MDRQKEILKINKEWCVETFISLMAYAHNMREYDHPFFEDLQRLEDLYLEEDKTDV